MFVYSVGKAELWTFQEEVNFLGVEAVCKVSDQINFMSGGVSFGSSVFGVSVVSCGPFVSVLDAGCVLLFISIYLFIYLLQSMD